MPLTISRYVCVARGKAVNEPFQPLSEEEERHTPIHPDSPLAKIVPARTMLIVVTTSLAVLFGCLFLKLVSSNRDVQNFLLCSGTVFVFVGVLIFMWLNEKNEGEASRLDRITAYFERRQIRRHERSMEETRQYPTLAELKDRPSARYHERNMREMDHRHSLVELRERLWAHKDELVALREIDAEMRRLELRYG
jgi:hypothetical protein